MPCQDRSDVRRGPLQRYLLDALPFDGRGLLVNTLARGYYGPHPTRAEVGNVRRSLAAVNREGHAYPTPAGRRANRWKRDGGGNSMLAWLSGD